MTITILKYAAFACQIGVVVCGLVLLAWHMVRLFGGVRNAK